MREFIAFDIGATLIKYGILTEDGKIIKSGEMNTDAHLGGMEVVGKVKKMGDVLLQEYAVSGVCISTAGQVNSEKGKIVYASELIPEYTGVAIKAELENHFNLPVEVENDVNCVGLAESWIGKGKDVKSLFSLTIGSGIGGSYVLDNKLHTGYSFSGGEIGYIPIEGSQFEELASTRILIQNVANKKKVDPDKLNGKNIFDMAHQGDAVCQQEIERMVYYLSKGIATIAYMMNPEMIVLGGGITKQKDYLLPLIQEELAQGLIPTIFEKTKVEIAEKLNNAGMVGALRHFLLKEAVQPYNRLTTLIESNRKRLTKGEESIANFILKNMTEVLSTTISYMADKIGVSDSMITRFCKKLNIRSFSELRILAQESSMGTRLHEKVDESYVSEIEKDYMHTFKNITTLNEKLDMEQLIEVVTSVDKVFIYGTSDITNVTQILKYKLMNLGIQVDTFTNKIEMNASKHLLDNNTAVIGISVSGDDDEVVNMLNYAKEKNTRIGITSQQNSPLLNISNISILVASTEVVHKFIQTTSEISILYIFDLLSHHLQRKQFISLSKMNDAMIEAGGI